MLFCSDKSHSYSLLTTKNKNVTNHDIQSDVAFFSTYKPLIFSFQARAAEKRAAELDMGDGEKPEEKETEEDAEEKRWRKERYEREKFLDSQKVRFSSP